MSAQISHDHIATAFHFLISNLGGAAVFAAGLEDPACKEKGEKIRTAKRFMELD